MEKAKVLVVGGGGREHAIAWKLAQSPKVDRVYVAPGNAGTATEAGCENVQIGAEDIDRLVEFAQSRGVRLTVVGPEAPLAAGIADRFAREGLRIFGPTRDGAQLEASKAHAKSFLQRHGIPTAGYETHTDADAAEDCVRRFGAPVVVKADGLAAGKGVVVAASLEEGCAAARDMLAGNRLGDAGRRVVIEQFLAGEEASFIVVVANGHALEFASSQDHKRVGDRDTGPNTGGMGAYSPAPVVTPAVHDRIIREVIDPTLAGLRKDGVDFTGFLYAGLMIDPSGAPRVLEFNCRLGDPETQPLLMRLRSDLYEILDAAVDNRLDAVVAQWDERCALGVVMAAAGYPASVRKGDVISGLADVPGDAKVFHAGTVLRDGGVVTSGGRVLCVVALGDDVADAQRSAYAAVGRITWPGEHHRSDIGFRAIGRRD